MKSPEAIDAGGHLRKRKWRNCGRGLAERWGRINRFIDLDRRPGSHDPAFQSFQQDDAPGSAKSGGKFIVGFGIRRVEHEIQGDHGRATRGQLFDHAGMEGARPWPAARRQTQGLCRGPILSNDDDLGRRRQGPSQPKQHKFSEPVLYAAAEQISAEQQPGDPGREGDKPGSAEPGPAPPPARPQWIAGGHPATRSGYLSACPQCVP